MERFEKPYVGALDQGTTSTRCIIFDVRGRVVAQDQVEHHQHYPAPGQVEHDAQEIYGNALKVIVGAMNKANLKPQDLQALGITNQRETVVVWDRHTGVPIHNALVWQDTRTAGRCTELEATHGDFLRQRTGLPPATYFSASKLAWILDQVPGAREEAARGNLACGTIDSWLVWRLNGEAGVHVTDPSNACRTQLYNIHTRDWDPDLLEFWNIPRAILPELRPSSHRYGPIRSLPGGLALGAILGDQQSALLGQGCVRPGDTKNTYGTGCFMLMNTGPAAQTSAHGLLTSVAWDLPGLGFYYCLEGSVAMAGATVQWLRDNLGIIGSSAEVEALARSVDHNGGVYFVPAFGGLYAPWWNSGARGSLHGLTRYATRAHIARAALEATAYQTLDVLEAMEKDAGRKLAELRVDGGMTVNSFLMQFQADILGIPVQRPRNAEATSLGAAGAAGLALGVYGGVNELPVMMAEHQTWEPAMDGATRAAYVERWRKALDRSLDWL